jgi:hypothetical protein
VSGACFDYIRCASKSRHLYAFVRILLFFSWDEYDLELATSALAATVKKDMELPLDEPCRKLHVHADLLRNQVGKPKTSERPELTVGQGCGYRWMDHKIRSKGVSFSRTSNYNSFHSVGLESLTARASGAAGEWRLFWLV